MTTNRLSVDERVKLQMEHVRSRVATRHGLSELVVTDARDQARIDDAARLAVITAHWGVASNIPVVGPAVVLWRRVVRLLLRWYINPIVEQQNRFNQATVRALFDLQLELDDLRAEIVHANERTMRE